MYFPYHLLFDSLLQKFLKPKLHDLKISTVNLGFSKVGEQNKTKAVNLANL